MVSEKIPNRWLILFASLAINVCIGSLYAWSVYRIPLMEVLQASASEATLAVSISLGVIPIAMIVAGKFQDRVGPKPVIFIGGIIFGAAMILTGFVSSLSMLYITYGVLGGAGVGTIYACTVANTVKFFPDKRGLASGLVVAGFGSGAVLIGPLSRWLIEIYTVLPTFQILGVAYVVLISLCVTQVKTAPVGFAPAGWTPPVPTGGGTAAAAPSVDKNWREMLSDPLFFILYGVYTIACLSGLTLIAHASPIAQEVTSVTAAVAAAAVGYMALANTGGRIFWGWASDKIGRFNVLYVMFGITALMMIGMSQVTTIVPYVVLLMAVVLCFGGFMGCFPSITAETFGAKNLGMNYGIIFTAYGVAGIAGPLLAARIRETTGSYTMAFIIFGGMSVLGIALSFLAKQATQKRMKA